MRTTPSTSPKTALTAYDKAMRMNYSNPAARAYAHLTISALNSNGFTCLAADVEDNMQQQSDHLTQH